MAKMVIFAGLIAVFIGVILRINTELHKLRERLDEIETSLSEYKQTDCGKSQEYNNQLATTVTQFAGNNLVRSWWLGTQGMQGRKQEEE